MEITASLVNDLIQGTHLKDKQTVIVDAGDGKGYLSSRLALEFGHNVLGIDSNPNNTENALERNKKLKVSPSFCMLNESIHSFGFHMKSMTPKDFV